MARAWSKISIDFGNEHRGANGERSQVFSMRPGSFYEIPEWVEKHPMWDAATKPYRDPHGIDREADIVLFNDINSMSFPTLSPQNVLPVSGTNVSDNPHSGKPKKGAYSKNVDDAAQPAPSAAVDSSLTDGTGE